MGSKMITFTLLVVVPDPIQTPAPTTRLAEAENPRTRPLSTTRAQAQKSSKFFMRKVEKLKPCLHHEFSILLKGNLTFPSHFEADFRMTDLSKYSLPQQDTNWLVNSSLKQRSLPTKLVKRSTKQNNSDSDELGDISSISTNPPSANSITAAPISYDEYGGSDMDDDLTSKPPAKSMFDLELIKNDQDDSNIMNKFSNSNFQIKPNDYKNIFNKNAKINSDNSLTEKDDSSNHAKILPSAVLISGFDNFEQVLFQFSKYGTILEEFVQHQQQVTSVRVPIFMGNNWCKLTYSTPAAAIRALRETNGSLVVEPYTKARLETFLGHDIPPSLDVGCSLSDLEKTPTDADAPVPAISGRLKDGSNLLLQKKPTKKLSKVSVGDAVSSFFFGKALV